MSAKPHEPDERPDMRSEPDAESPRVAPRRKCIEPVHFDGLQGAATVQTSGFMRTQNAISDLAERLGMGAVYGPSGAGKTFAVRTALSYLAIDPVVVDIQPRPTMRQVTMQ